MGSDPHADYYKARTERVTPQNAEAWRGKVRGILSRRDQTDLARLEAKLPAHVLIRYLAAGYQSPETTKDLAPRWANVCRDFGETIEDVALDYMKRETRHLEEGG